MIALSELRQKSIDQIQMETAYTWAYRAWAAKELGLERDAAEYSHEAIEHGALAGDEVLHRVRQIIAG
jgi:hypothetical protein